MTPQEREEWDERLCDALMAARHGKYDGLTVEQHLENLIAFLRVPREPMDPKRAVRMYLDTLESMGPSDEVRDAINAVRKEQGL